MGLGGGVGGVWLVWVKIFINESFSFAMRNKHISYDAQKP